MAQTALPAPQSHGRRRAFFGLFDADGWPWAGAKAAFWFVLIIILLGYLPDRAYYFTVQKTVDIGLLAWSPINFCPPENETLPCPPPQGASLTWHLSPDELNLPAARTDGVAVALATTYLYVGGSDGTKASDSVYVTKAIGTGNFDHWKDGPKLPAPRADAASASIGNTLYVLGGLDADGKPTDTVYSLTVANDGTLGAWKTEDALKLPEPLAGASAVSVSDGLVLMGGKGANGLTKNVWKTQQANNAFGKWVAQSPLYEENLDGVAFHVGNVVFLVGGSNNAGPVASVQQGLLGGPTATTADPNAMTAQWRVSSQTNLPVARTNLAGFTANGALYVQGGSDGTSPRPETYWAIPDANGVIPNWSHLVQLDLGDGVQGSSAFTAGSHAFLAGGTASSGVTAKIARANLAPQPPFFQLGLLGATIPALKLDGEIGQQLGYLAAAGVGTVNFILLILIGWAYAHPDRVRAFVAERRRRRAARE
jgi:N-acetylneuraminic acid mutarotase